MPGSTHSAVASGPLEWGDGVEFIYRLRVGIEVWELLVYKFCFKLKEPMFLHADYGMLRHEGVEVAAIGFHILYVERGYAFVGESGTCPKKCCVPSVLS
jgi:hypothetical protein